jgi:predicted HTH domain antitoxin
MESPSVGIPARHLPRRQRRSAKGVPPVNGNAWVIIIPMVDLTLHLPESLAREIESARQEFLLELLERGWRELKIDRALELYSRGGMSFGAAAVQAGVSQSDLARLAYSRGLEPPFSEQILSEELSS